MHLFYVIQKIKICFQIWLRIGCCEIFALFRCSPCTSIWSTFMCFIIQLKTELVLLLLRHVRGESSWIYGWLLNYGWFLNCRWLLNYGWLLNYWWLLNYGPILNYGWLLNYGDFELWVTFEIWVKFEVWVSFELWVTFKLLVNF